MSLKAVPAPVTLPPNARFSADGQTIIRRVFVGSGPTQQRGTLYYPVGTPKAVSDRLVAEEQTRLAALRGPQAAKGTINADILTYEEEAELSKANHKRRKQQQRWWAAQSVLKGAPVLTPAQVAEGASGQGKTVGELSRQQLCDEAHLKRVREILKTAFPKDEDDPALNGGTFNKYRFALLHLFTVLDQDRPLAVNPIKTIKTRPNRGVQLKGVDMRIVRDIVRLAPASRGRSSRANQLRLAVLADTFHITPQQLRDVKDPVAAFHDVPDATRQDMIEGLITVTVPARHKGRQAIIPPPQTIPLTPYGVAAWRAYVAEPTAWASAGCSGSSLNKFAKHGAAKAQALYQSQGLQIDLSQFTVYCLKHSIASLASEVSLGRIDHTGEIRQDPAVIAALAHRKATTTKVYTQASVSPILLAVNVALSLRLDRDYQTPLAPAPRAVKTGTR